MNQSTQTNPLKKARTLLQRWNKLQQTQPNIRIRNAAYQLDVSEAELLATQCGETVTRLKPDWSGILYDLKSLGTVMVLTRNDSAVHEKIGRYNPLNIIANQARLVTDELEIRLMLEQWHFAFAVQEDTSRKQRFSLQFFDVAGVAIHKVYLTENSDQQAFNAVVRKFRHSDQSRIIKIQPSDNSIHNDTNVSVDAFRQYWRYLKHPQDFETMLTRFKVSRFEAMALAGTEFVQPVDPVIFLEFIKTLTEIKLPINLMVQNQGAIQIHKGSLHHLKLTGPWLNILDKIFNLHLLQETINNMYIVEKPMVTGKINTLELYNAAGENILILSGENDADNDEDPRWFDLIQSLPAKKEAA